jgi:putative SOS response-associated peptidase YedK
VYHLAGFHPFSLAGIWTAREIDGEWSHNFAIITRPAESYLEYTHDRMPALIEPDDYDRWLSVDTRPDDAEAMLHQYFERVQTHPVSTFVNKPENDSPRCIERVSQIGSRQ